MIRIFCDICNKDITNEKENFATVSIFSKEYDFKKLKVAPRLVEKKYQLCSECSQKLKNFLDKEVKS